MAGPDGERISKVETKLESIEEMQRERHQENTRKLDAILFEVRKTNGRVSGHDRDIAELRAVNTAREGLIVERVRRLDAVCEDVDALKETAAEIKGKGGVMNNLRDYIAPAVAGILVGLVMLLARKLWG